MMAKPSLNGPRPGDLRLGFKGPVEDAEFETVTASPRSTSNVPAKRSLSPKAPGGLAILSKQQQTLRWSDMAQWPGGSYWSLVFIAAVAAFWMSGGYLLVIPNSQTPTERSHGGMQLANAHTRVEQHPAGDVIFIEASIRNDGTSTARAPALIVTVKDGNGLRRDHRIVAEQASLAPGGNMAFSSRIPAPHGSVADVRLALRAPTL